MTGYDTVVFDNDGVLVTPPAYKTKVEAARAAFESVGVDDVDQEHVDGVVSGVTVDGLDDICTVYDLELESLWAAREEYDEQSQLEKFKAGVRDCYDDITALENFTQNCGIVSNNHHSTVEFIVEYFDLESLFDTYYGRENTIESLELKKPNTYYLDQALADLDAESALYVGDKETDIIAAQRAGIDSAFIRRSHCEDVTLSTAPTYEVADLHELSEIAAERTA